MKRITLPNTDLQVSQISYGTASFDGSFPIEDGLRLFETYVRAGGNFIDTAHCYCFWVPGGDGASERSVGAAVREFGRDKFVVATKGGHVGMNGYPRPDAFMTPELVRQDLEESLGRLGLHCVDLYYLHRDDPRMPVNEIIEAMNEHVAAGRTKYLGASNWSVARFLEANAHAKAHALQPFSILQNQWSLARPDWKDLTSPGAVRYIEDGELPVLAEQQIVLAAFTPTAAGYFATDGERGKSFESEENRRQLIAVQELAKRHSAAPGQVALAYLLNQPFPVIPVLGTRNAAHLLESLEATKIALTSEEIMRLQP